MFEVLYVVLLFCRHLFLLHSFFSSPSALLPSSITVSFYMLMIPFKIQETATDNGGFRCKLNPRICKVLSNDWSFSSMYRTRGQTATVIFFGEMCVWMRRLNVTKAELLTQTKCSTVIRTVGTIAWLSRCISFSSTTVVVSYVFKVDMRTGLLVVVHSPLFWRSVS